MTGTRSPLDVSTKLQQIAELAKRRPGDALTTLAHHIDMVLLREAHRRTRKDGAPGTDHQTADVYGENLDANLESLLRRFKTGEYRAPPVRRVHIPKGDGKTRPIGIPTFEDKVLQRAVTMVMEAVYEQSFLDCSYGFRPGRSAHQALAALRQGLMQIRQAWVLDVDIQRFFDTLDHRHLRAFLDQRVRDGVLRRMIDKWLRAGVLEGGELEIPEEGTPQGGVISPLLANVYLHEVLDIWFARDVQPRLSGRGFMIRYADDAVFVFSSESDARRTLADLAERLGRFGLSLHPEKTRLVEFRSPSRWQKPPRSGRPGTFDMLGFTHHWGQTLKRTWALKQRTMRSRLTRALTAIAAWCRTNRHEPIPEQHRTLSAKVRGHFAYYGIAGNYRALARFVREVRRIWQKWLNRRSQGNRMPWIRFNRLLQRYALPAPRIVHAGRGAS